jgi:nucleoside 2-deoxyribosyltransferase
VKIYLAGPLFSEGQRSWQMRIKQGIQNWAALQGLALDVVYPYELVESAGQGGGSELAGQGVFDLCEGALRETDLLVATLDGAQVDDGTAWEMGFFYAFNRGARERILGIRTDFRRAGDAEGTRVNAMLDASCGCIAGSLEELLQRLAPLVSGTAPAGT